MTRYIIKRLKLPVIMLLLTTVIQACGEAANSEQNEISETTELADSIDHSDIQDSFYLSFIDSVYTISGLTGGELIIQNSFPKGGGHIDTNFVVGYKDPFETHYGYGVFWSHLINHSEDQLKFDIRFSSDSLVLEEIPESYFKLYLPTDSMNLKNVMQHNYGIQGLRAYLDTNVHKPSRLEIELKPGESAAFFVASLIYKPDGPVRAALMVEDGKLSYRIAMLRHGQVIIPCGEMHVLKN